MQQEAINRAAVRAALVCPGGYKILLLCPHPAAVERTLPRRVAETWRFWPNVVGIYNRAKEMGDDLNRFPENVREECGFGASSVDGPGCAAGAVGKDGPTPSGDPGRVSNAAKDQHCQSCHCFANDMSGRAAQEPLLGNVVHFILLLRLI